MKHRHCEYSFRFDRV